MNRTLHKTLSMLVAAALVANMGLSSVFAQGTAADAPELNDSGELVEKACTCEPTLGADEAGHAMSCPLYTVKDSGAFSARAPVMDQAALRAAVAAAVDGDTISLGDSFELTGGYLSIEEKAITLDLNGKNLTIGDVDSRISVAVGSKLTLSGGVDGKLTSSMVKGIIDNYGQLIITGGTVENSWSNAIINSGTGTLIVTGGNVKATSIGGLALENYGSGSITVEGNAKISGSGNVILNSGSGTININGGTVNAEGGSAVQNSGTGTVNISGGEVSARDATIFNENSDSSQRGGTVNVTGGTVTSTGMNDDPNIGTTILNIDGEVVVGGTAEVFSYGSNEKSCAIGNGTTDVTSSTLTIEGNALVEASGKNAPCAIDNFGQLTVGENAKVRAASDGAVAIYNQSDLATTLMIKGNAVVEAAGVDGLAIYNSATCTIDGGTVQAVAEKSRAIYNVNSGTCTINGGTVQAVAQKSTAIYNNAPCTIKGGTVQAGGLESYAVLNDSDMHIYGGEIIGTIGNDNIRNPIYVYPSTTLSANVIGLPVIFGTGTDLRIAVSREKTTSTEFILEVVADYVPGASLPDADDPKGFFMVTLESKNADGDWEIVDGGLPEGAALLLPFPAGADEYKNNYKVISISSESPTPMTVFDATGKEYGIECDPAYFGTFVAAKFARHMITFNANGGMPEPDRVGTDIDGKLSALPTPTRGGYTFDGWFTALEGGTKVTLDTKYTQDTTIYARWSTASTAITVTFDANGGAISPSSAGTVNGKLSALPIPKRDGYKFDGWFTASTGGTKVTLDDTYTQSTTIYAHWTAGGDSSSDDSSSDGSSSGGSSSDSSSSGGSGGGSGSSSGGNGGIIGGNSGGSSGGTQKTDKPSSNVGSTGAVKPADVTKETAEAVAAAVKSGNGSKANVTVKNAASVTPQTLKDMAAAASKSGGTVQLLADSVADGKVTARLYIDPALAASITSDIQLGVALDEKSVKSTTKLFEKSFDNKVAVASFAQQGEFGFPLHAAIMVDLTGMNTKTLHFYSYDRATNQYQPIESPAYWIDASGYLHFTTTRGGDIVITDKPLVPQIPQK